MCIYICTQYIGEREREGETERERETETERQRDRAAISAPCLSHKLLGSAESADPVSTSRPGLKPQEPKSQIPVQHLTSEQQPSSTELMTQALNPASLLWDSAPLPWEQVGVAFAFGAAARGPRGRQLGFRVYRFCSQKRLLTKAARCATSKFEPQSYPQLKRSNGEAASRSA